MAIFQLTVNGTAATVNADGTKPLLFVLREDLHLTGAKPGCGEGQCGACTVLLDGKPIHSCLTPLADVGSRPILTIEGLASGPELHPVQQAFLDHSAFQCGFCTPGMIMATVGFLNTHPKPSMNDMRTGLNGNVCRCGTYSRIIKAVQQVAEGVGRA